MKPTFLLINTDGCFLGLAQRLDAEGYETFSYYDTTCEKYSGKAGEGIVEVIDDQYDIINKFADKKDELIILIDGNTGGDEMDFLRKEGFHVIGSSNLTESFEHERKKGEDLAKKMTLNIPPSKSFGDFNSAKMFLELVDKQDPTMRLVFKGDGLEMAGGSFTYLANSPQEMLKYLGWVENQKEAKVEKFMFQQIVEGIEVDFAGWWNGNKFAPIMAVDFEQKRIHGLGKAVGCLGQIEFYLDATKEPYFKKYISKLVPELKGDVGNEWAVNNIVDASGEPFFLEFTPRHGWDSTVGEMALLKDAGKSIGEFYEHIAFKTPFPKDFFPFNRYSCAVRIHTGSISEKPADVKGRPIFWDEKFNDNFWWYAIKKKDENYELTGNPVGVAVACGDTPEEAMNRVYAILDPSKDHIVLPDIFYSETIGEGVSENIKKLKSLGIIK